MANSKIKIKQNEMIENNIKLIEIIFYVFRGQVLDLDLKEFCLKYAIYQTEGQYNTVIKNLISNNILKTKKLVNTNNNVVIARAPIYNFFGLEKRTTKYSIETVTRNSYMNYIIQQKIKMNEDGDIIELAERLKNKTTLIAKKRDVLGCYKPYIDNLTDTGEEAFKDALFNEEKRKIHLKHIEKEELEHRGIAYKETIQTLVERDIYTLLNKQGTYKIFIIDNNSDFVFSNLVKKIALVIKILGGQVKQQEKLEIVVYVKNEASKRKIENNFITKYSGGQKVNIDNAINEAIEDTQYKISLKFAEKNENEFYILKNQLQDKFNRLRIKIENTNIAYKHNSDMKAQALINYKQEQKEKKQREKVVEELRAKGLLKEKPKKKKEHKKEIEELDDI